MLEMYKNYEDPAKDELKWDATITDAVTEKENEPQRILEEGDYFFTVKAIEKGMFWGGKKIPPCDKATVNIEIPDSKGDVTLKFDLYLHKLGEWRLAAFFRCLGLKKPGENFKMDWGSALSKQGRAHIKKRTFKTYTGEEKTVNEVGVLYDYDPKLFNNWEDVASDDDLPF